MTKEEWKTVIEEQIKYDHDYIPSFQTTINILCELLSERDSVYQMYIDSGASPVVNFTSDRGAVNLKPNPLLRQWQDMTVTALSYLRDLGLTAAGLRKLQGQIPKQKLETKDSVLEQLRNTYALNKYTGIDKSIDVNPSDSIVKTPSKKTTTKTTKKTTKRSVKK